MRTLVLCAVALFAVGCADIETLESEPETESAPMWADLDLCDPNGTPGAGKAACDDGDPFTMDRCEKGMCTHVEAACDVMDPIELQQEVCNDGNACTADRCTAIGTCDALPINGCFVSSVSPRRDAYSAR